MQQPAAVVDWRHDPHAQLIHAARAEVLAWIERRTREHHEPAAEQFYLVLDLRSEVGREVAVPILNEIGVRRRVDRAARAHCPPAFVIPMSRSTFLDAMRDVAPVYSLQVEDRPAGAVTVLVIDAENVPRVVHATPGVPPLGRP